MRKNILIIGHNYATQFIDIYNQYTRLFDRDKYAVTVAYLTGEPNEDVRLRTLAEEVIFLNYSKKSIRGLKIDAIGHLVSLCKEKNYQIVICHRYKPSYIMMWAAQFHRIPALFFVMHELKTMSSTGRKLLITCLNHNNMVFAGVSNAVRDDLRRSLWRVPEERIVTLYNMIDVELTEPQLFSKAYAREQLKIPDDVFVFGNVARLVPNKDQKNLIQAFSLIKPYCPKAKLLILGNGVLEAQLKEQVAALNLNDDVIFTGFVAGGFRYMKAFDCFVLSSIQEAFGRVLLEAMIAKCPIIATRTNGIPEVVGDTSIIVNPKSTDELAFAMKKIYLLSHQDRESMAEKAYKYMVENFSIPIFHKQFWELPLAQSIKD
jgi:glycosyltransferase involved in cell wall biosynthesis